MRRRIIAALVILSFVIASCNNQLVKYIPANKNATPEAKALYHKMGTLLNKGIMFGHQDTYLYGVEWKTEGISDVKQVSGDFPAVFGWELGDLELGNKASLDSVKFDEIREGIIWAHENGAINTISWHTNNPLTAGSAWDTSSDQVVKSILPNGEKNADYIDMLDKTANFLLSLSDKNGKLIPLIFRPYHEHTGNWFWWGQRLCSTDQYIALWQLTVDYFNSRGLNNLLYAYSAAGNLKTANDFMERYPGNEIVDFVGFDTYQHSIEHRDGYMDGIKNQMEIIIPIATQNNKIPILAETGFNAIPDSQWWTATLWPAIQDYSISYVLVWRNAYDRANHFYAPYPGCISADNFIEFKALDSILFLNDIQEK